MITIPLSIVSISNSAGKDEDDQILTSTSLLRNAIKPYTALARARTCVYVCVRTYDVVEATATARLKSLHARLPRQ